MSSKVTDWISGFQPCWPCSCTCKQIYIYITANRMQQPQLSKIGISSLEAFCILCRCFYHFLPNKDVPGLLQPDIQGDLIEGYPSVRKSWAKPVEPNMRQFNGKISDCSDCSHMLPLCHYAMPFRCDLSAPVSAHGSQAAVQSY